MLPQYKYLKINRKLYFCIRQNPVGLAFLLYLKGKPLTFGSGRFIETLKNPSRFLSYVKEMIKYLISLRSNDWLLKLPFIKSYIRPLIFIPSVGLMLIVPNLLRLQISALEL